MCIAAVHTYVCTYILMYVHVRMYVCMYICSYVIRMQLLKMLTHELKAKPKKFSIRFFHYIISLMATDLLLSSFISASYVATYEVIIEVNMPFQTL